jgi:hypothetical protein
MERRGARRHRRLKPCAGPPTVMGGPIPLRRKGSSLNTLPRERHPRVPPPRPSPRAPCGLCLRALPPRCSSRSGRSRSVRSSTASRSALPSPSRSSTTSLPALHAAAALAFFHHLAPRAPPGRNPRVPPPRRSHALRAAAALALFHRASLRAPPSPCPRVLPPRRSHALHAAAALAVLHRVALFRVLVGRCPRVLPPRRAHALRAAATRASFHRVALTRPSRPPSSRSSTTPLCASRSAATFAFCHLVALRTLAATLRAARHCAPHRAPPGR